MPIPLQGKIYRNVRHDVCVGEFCLKLIQGEVKIESIAANYSESDTDFSRYLVAYLLSWLRGTFKSSML